jgi:hypothetical protein
MSMTVDQIKARQLQLKNLGYYTGKVDGSWGPKSVAAEAQYADVLAKQKLATATVTPTTAALKGVIWSNKVSPEFIASVKWIADALEMPEDGVNMLMACMAWESGRTFSPSVKNAAGSGATGLIQFMPSTAKTLGTTVNALAKMSDIDQLNYVYKYFAGYKGRLKNLGDVYMAILWPGGVGKLDSYVLWDKDTRPTTYRQNSGLDVNKDGVITRAECLVKIRQLYEEGKKNIAA